MSEQIRIVPVSSAADVSKFVKLPYKIYENDPWWVPPLESEITDLLDPEKNFHLQKGPYQFLLAFEGDEVLARLGVGIDGEINKAKEKKEGYITLFESLPNYQAFADLLDFACNWLREQGMERVGGPISPTRGDDYRGILIKGFGSSPVMMNPYNPAYYPEFFDRYGFEKDSDFCAYYYDLRKPIDPKLTRGVGLAKKRYGFDVYPLDMKNIDQEILDIKKILDEAMPADWEHLVPPGVDELQSIADKLLKFAQPGLINIARKGKRPIGFALALPDYNQVLKKVGGKLNLLGILKFLWNKNKITGGRIFVMFVVPEFHRKGVSAAIYLHTFHAARKLGYTYGEGSQIGEWNGPMRRDAEGVGGKLYKMYRLYKMDLKND